MNTPRITFRFNEGTRKKLKAMSDKSGRNMSDYLRLLIDYANDKKLKL